MKRFTDRANGSVTYLGFAIMATIVQVAFVAQLFAGSANIGFA